MSFTAPGDANATQSAALFDLHLKLLSESYLAFFVQRKKIEEQYVASLMKLHRKSKTIDVDLDDRTDLSAVRIAWNEIADNVEQEAGAHQAFLEILGTQVIDPLNNFKEGYDRIRKRIREDIKDAISAYNEYAENTLPLLKRNYLKKCMAAEELATLATSSTFPQESNDEAPMSQSPHWNRSPSILTTSTTLSDLGYQGKRQLMTFLNRGGNARDGGRSDSFVRHMRAKREEEEADKLYRKGVHWQETLRIRLVNLVKSGFKSVEAFVRESSGLLRNVLSVYMDSLTDVGGTQIQLCENGRRTVNKIVPERDGAAMAAKVPGMLFPIIPTPKYYFNYFIGECRDLMFGVSLVDYAARDPLEGDKPKIIRVCIEDIDQRGLEAEGIYWVSGSHATVQELQRKIERNEAAFALNPTMDDVYSVSSLLKTYLRELPEPVFKFPLHERILHTERIDEHITDNFSLLRSRIRQLPPSHQATLWQALVEHLARVASRSNKNKMDSKNLATIFGSMIFGEDEMPNGTDTLVATPSWKDTLMEDLLMYAHIVFQQSDCNSASSSSETAAPLTCDSQDTNVLSSIPPQLPLRPVSSIIRPSLGAEPHVSCARQMPSVRSGRFFDDDMLISGISLRENRSSS
ncbi:RhoGAP-domain-containing protein [Ganoderma leucocontextum]|nr:RhoGAP-domain-containing protein [Ganoderma leucocontextum]